MPFLGVTLDALSQGIITKPEGCDDMRWCRTDGGGCLDPGGLPSRGQRRRMEYTMQCQKPVPAERVQCEEALFDRQTGEWTCMRTGESCGYGTNPACAKPPALSAWTEDLAQGVVKRRVTEDGKVVYEEPATPTIESMLVQPEAAAPAAGLSPILLGAIALGAFLLFGGKS